MALNAAGWVVLSLLVAGALLDRLNRYHLEKDFDRLLMDHLEEVATVSFVDGDAVLVWAPADERFTEETSAWYWQIQADGRPLLSSVSMKGRVLPFPPMSEERQVADIPGFDGRPLRLWTQRLETRGPNGSTLVAAVAAPRDDMAGDITHYSLVMAATLGVLGVGLITAAVFQVRMGVRPLYRLGQGLTDIRAGRRDHLPEDFPEELRAVVVELNALLDYNKALVERARGQAADMAHSLKNPLSVIRNDVRTLEGPVAARLARKVDTVIATIESHLARSRTAGTINLLNASTSVADVADDIVYSLDLLYRERNLRFSRSGLDPLRFRGDPQDLEEILGALLDNACKFAAGEVTLTGRQARDRLVLTIADDGPGMPEEARRSGPVRGRRLDTTKPGTGLGLSIVADLVHLYGGSVSLDVADQGGLAVAVNLPAAVPVTR